MSVFIRLGEDETEVSWDEFEARVRAGRVPDDALIREATLTGDAWRAASTIELYTSLRDDPAAEWTRRYEHAGPPLATALIVGLNVRLFWLARLGPIRDSLVDMLAAHPSLVFEDGQGWRLLTMGVLQTEWLHASFNMIWLAYVGWSVERAYGWRNMVAVYVGAVLGGSVLSTVLSTSGAPSIGASGGVFGLIAAAVVFGLRFPHLLPERARLRFGFAMLPYMVLMFVSGLTNEDTDNLAHLGGLLVGLALGVALAPVGLETHNRRDVAVRASVWGFAVAAFIAPYLVGPRVVRLRDAPNADVAHQVPVGWRPGRTATGRIGAVATTAPRAISVDEQRNVAPLTVEALAEQWRSALMVEVPGARADAARAATVAGWAGLRMDARLPAEEGEDPIEVHWYGVARGRWSLEVTFEVESTRARHLAPLEQRLLAGVAWPDPPPLVSARDAVERAPAARRARRELARALADVGEVSEAIALSDTLLAESAEDHESWSLRIELQRAADPAGDDALVTAALVDASPLRVVEVAALLEARGRDLEAAGLLQLAWAWRPGDRDLARARRARGMPRRLDDAGRPIELAYDPVRAAPSGDDRLAVLSAPVSLGAARVAGQRLEDEMTQVIARVLAGVGSASDWRYVHDRAWDPAPPAEAIEQLRGWIQVVRDGSPTDAFPPAVADAVRDGLAPSW